MPDQRLVVYTVLTGAKEALGDPLSTLDPGGEQTDLQFDWVCFTDNPALRSDRWQIRLLDEPLPPERSSRRPKCLPHDYLGDWEHSLYIDNIVRFSRLPTAAEIGLGAPLRAFRHATRKDPMSEAEAIVQLGYESVDTLAAQLDFYRERGLLQRIDQLSTCTLILRRHHDPQVRRLGQLWWEQFLLWGKRDQMSFDIALKLSGVTMDYWPGLKNDCPWLVFVPNVSKQRVLANFDVKRYRWRYRDDPAAQADPRRHYLEVGAQDGHDHGSRSQLFEWLCYRLGASLGRQLAPRRGVADWLDAALSAQRGQGVRLLLLEVQGGQGPAVFTPAEVNGAADALATLLAPQAGVRLELSTAQLLARRSRVEASLGKFDVVVALGLGAAELTALVDLLRHGALASAGLLLILLREAADPTQLLALQQHLQAALPADAKVQLSVMPSQHDALDQPLANAVLLCRWGGR